MYFRAVLGGTGADTTVGARRHQLVTNALRPRYRLFLRARDHSNELILACPQQIHHGSALYKWHPGTADRLAFERYLYCDRQHNKQGRVAAQDAVSYGRWRWLDGDGWG